MERPGGALIEPALDTERPIGRLIGDLDLNATGRVRENERFANLKIFDHKRLPLKKLNAGFQDQLDESRRWKNDVVFDLVIFEERHVPAVEPGGPGGCRARQPRV